MSNFQDLQHKVFFEVKTILESLAKVSSAEELLTKQDLFSEAADRMSFLKILEKNKDAFEVDTALQGYDNEDINIKYDFVNFIDEDQDLDDFLSDDEPIEEEVLFTTEINELEEAASEDIAVNPTVEVENFKEKLVDAAQEAAYEDRVAQKEREFRELEEKRRKIVEFNKDQKIPPSGTEPQDETSAAQHKEKKFKLAHIKGLKAVQNLFDEDPLEKLRAERDAPNAHRDSGSILKTNIPTDFMEAEKRRPEFRLDLNDKVAFTKLLFNGHEEELTQTIARLNSYDNAEDAKQYLSELYYAKDWKKADEYAQRLWSLVENKFL